MATMRMISVTVLLLVGMALADAYCPFGFSRYNKRCFRVFAEKKTWTDAEKRCQSLGGNLASIHSGAEYIFVQALIDKVDCHDPHTWLGGHDSVKESTWFWTDGTKMDWTNWYPGQPDNFRGHEHCLTLNFGDTKQWNDVSCTSTYPYVCARRG